MEGLLWPTRFFSVKQEQWRLRKHQLLTSRGYTEKATPGGLNGWRGRPDWHWSGNGARNWRNAFNLWNHLCASGEIPKPDTARPVSAAGMSVTVAPVETTRVARTLNTTGTAARDLIAVLPQTTGLQIKQTRGSRRCCQNRTGDGSSGHGLTSGT